MDWAGALTAASTAVKIAKDLREIDRGLDQAELKARLADVISNMADVRIALTDARDEMRERDAEIDRLKEAFKFSGRLVEKDGFKFETFADGSPKGDAFCPRCEQNLGRYYRLNSVKGFAVYGCPECKATYQHQPANLWEQQGK